jgi:hypothetical protein
VSAIVSATGESAVASNAGAAALILRDGVPLTSAAP